jgi:hypothetical protein
MIERQRLDNGQWRVRFPVPGESAGHTACVVGDFNSWQPGATTFQDLGTARVATAERHPSATCPHSDGGTTTRRPMITRPTPAAAPTGPSTSACPRGDHGSGVNAAPRSPLTYPKPANPFTSWAIGWIGLSGVGRQPGGS